MFRKTRQKQLSSWISIGAWMAMAGLLSWARVSAREELMSVTTVLAYSPPVADGVGEPLKNSLLMLLLEYGAVYIWLVYNFWAGRKKKSSST